MSLESSQAQRLKKKYIKKKRPVEAHAKNVMLLLRRVNDCLEMSQRTKSLRKIESWLLRSSFKKPGFESLARQKGSGVMQHKRASFGFSEMRGQAWALDLLFGEATKGPERCGDRTALKDLSEDFTRA